MIVDAIALDEVAAVAKALASPHRLSIIQAVCSSGRSVEEIAEATGLSVANASQHLQLLRRSGLLTAKRDGKRIIYDLAGEGVVAALEALDALRRTTPAASPVRRVDMDELAALMAGDAIVLLDVRDPEPFAAGHIPGALNIPLAQVQGWTDRTPPRKPVVAYCNGPLCVLALEAAQHCRRQGLSADVLVGGIAGWRSAGRPVAAI